MMTSYEAVQEPPAAALSRLLLGKFVTQAVAIVARLGIADELAKGPRLATELARTVDVNADVLNRLLRALTVVGVFGEPEEKVFTLTPIGERLRSDVPGSMRA